MAKVSAWIRKASATIANDQGKGAQRAMLEELLQDYYLQRRKVYRMNFFRGIFFGAGSALGGTIILSLVVWLLSLFVQLPFVGGYVDEAKRSIDSNVTR
jgi:hypothetical protein